MRATLMYAAGDVRVENVPDATLVFDRTVRLDDVPVGYQAMNRRESIKVMVQP